MRRVLIPVAVVAASSGVAFAQQEGPDCAPYVEQVALQLEIAQGKAPETAALPASPDDTDTPRPELSEGETAALAEHVARARERLAAGDHAACMVEVQSAQAIAMPIEDSITSEQDSATGGTAGEPAGGGESN